jgi:hypothetical protein
MHDNELVIVISDIITFFLRHLLFFLSLVYKWLVMKYNRWTFTATTINYLWKFFSVVSGNKSQIDKVY